MCCVFSSAVAILATRGGAAVSLYQRAVRYSVQCYVVAILRSAVISVAIVLPCPSIFNTCILTYDTGHLQFSVYSFVRYRLDITLVETRLNEVCSMAAHFTLLYPKKRIASLVTEDCPAAVIEAAPPFPVEESPLQPYDVANEELLA